MNQQLKQKKKKIHKESKKEIKLIKRQYVISSHLPIQSRLVIIIIIIWPLCHCFAHTTKLFSSVLNYLWYKIYNKKISRCIWNKRKIFYQVISFRKVIYYYEFLASTLYVLLAYILNWYHHHPQSYVAYV